MSWSAMMERLSQVMNIELAREGQVFYLYNQWHCRAHGNPGINLEAKPYDQMSGARIGDGAVR